MINFVNMSGNRIIKRKNSRPSELLMKLIWFKFDENTYFHFHSLQQNLMLTMLVLRVTSLLLLDKVQLVTTNSVSSSHFSMMTFWKATNRSLF